MRIGVLPEFTAKVTPLYTEPELINQVTNLLQGQKIIPQKVIWKPDSPSGSRTLSVSVQLPAGGVYWLGREISDHDELFDIQLSKLVPLSRTLGEGRIYRLDPQPRIVRWNRQLQCAILLQKAGESASCYILLSGMVETN